MKIIYNDIIPFDGSIAMTICPLIFAKNDYKPLKDDDINHESIHGRQQIEMMIVTFAVVLLLVLIFHISLWWFLLVPTMFFIWYGIEYIIRVILYSNKKEGYRNIATEQEAYQNEDNLDYLKTRKPFAWLKYLFKKTYNRPKLNNIF